MSCGAFNWVNEFRQFGSKPRRRPQATAHLTRLWPDGTKIEMQIEWLKLAAYGPKLVVNH
jgi:hypothetical protein